MKANNLTISIPYKGCDKACDFCVSRITGPVKSNESLMYRNIEKVLTIARMSQVSSVMITGKGEPCLNFGTTLDFTRKFREFPLELQTNGLWLSKNILSVKNLADVGMNVVAVSIDDPYNNPVSELSEAIHKAGMILRVTFNATNMSCFKTEQPFKELFELMKQLDVDQFTFRKITNANFTNETKQSRWIADNVDQTLFTRLINEMEESHAKDMHLIRTLPYGSKVYDIQGIAVSYSNYCIQDDNATEDIRSLIFLESGHLATSWNSEASILF